MYERMKNKLEEIIEKFKVNKSSPIKIKTKMLSKEEALGNPMHDDYPLMVGKEKLMQADFNGSKGVAFTDMHGNYEGYLYDVMKMQLKNNFQRAIFIATLNAVLSNLGLIEKTEHCKDDGPIKCADKLKQFIQSGYPNHKVLLIGFQPRFAEVITANFDSKIIDLDSENIGKLINDVTIKSKDKTSEFVDWADLLFVTSSTFVNGTASQFILPNKKTIFYGVSGAGCSYLLDLERYCQQ
jgi:hypothetical protein